MSKTYEIVILGNNLAGISAAHYLLKHTFPALKGMKNASEYHITMVGPSNNVYYKISAPRALAAPDQISLNQIAFPMNEVFAQYPKEQFTWVQGLATHVGEDKKEVSIKTLDGGERAIPYDSLIICTGSKLDPLWSANDDFSATTGAFDAMHKALPNAKTVLIAGAGPVGVETAGELATKYPNAKITLLSGTERVLSALSNASSNKAEKMLKSMGVSVVHQKKVSSPQESSATPTTVTFQDGSTEHPDVYIHATGGQPNTQFLPSAWLNERGKVNVDFNSFRGPKSDVYAFGDAASNTKSTIMDIMFGCGPCMSSISQDLARKLDPQVKPTGSFRERNFKPMDNTQFVPVGPSGGVAQIMGWGLPSFVVWFVKARTFFLEKARPVVIDGEYAKA